jgi:hypothetical protein
MDIYVQRDFFVASATEGKKRTEGESFLIVIGTISACRRRSRSQSVGEWSRDRGAQKGVSASLKLNEILVKN